MTAKNGHHYFTFQALQAVDPAFTTVAIYFDQARDKRNDFSYDTQIAISDTDAEDLVKTVELFIAEVQAWIAKHHAALA